MYRKQIFIVADSDAKIMNKLYIFLLCFVVFSAFSKLTEHYSHSNDLRGLVTSHLLSHSDDGRDALL